MEQPSIWFILASEVVISGIALYGFYYFFVKPNLRKDDEDLPSDKA
jgi:hypothetical protein